jgi:hypothetical protein
LLLLSSFGGRPLSAYTSAAAGRATFIVPSTAHDTIRAEPAAAALDRRHNNINSNNNNKSTTTCCTPRRAALEAAARPPGAITIEPAAD